MMRSGPAAALFLVAGTLATAEPASVGGFNAARPEAVIRLELEPLLVDPTGIHPLNSPEEDLVAIGRGGSFNAIVHLGKDGTRNLLYSLSYEMTPDARISLRLHRSLRRGDKAEEELPDVTQVIEPFGAWTVPLLKDEETRTELRLRVVPIIRPAVEDVPFDSTQLSMWLKGGPLIQFNARTEEDRIIFRAVNILGARGLSLGVSGVGEIRISVDKFPGAAPCGYVRGHVLQFALGGHDYGIYSEREILPQDARRPGRGWTLYGLVDSSAKFPQGGSYGGFKP